MDKTADKFRDRPWRRSLKVPYYIFQVGILTVFFVMKAAPTQSPAGSCLESFLLFTRPDPRGIPRPTFPTPPHMGYELGFPIQLLLN